MDESTSHEFPLHLRLSIAVAAICCAALACFTYGTNDVLFFKSYASAFDNQGLRDMYQRGARLLEWHPELSERMSHPPAVLHLLRPLQFLCSETGAPFQTLFRIVTSLAHVTAILGIRKLLSPRKATFYALCPTAILIAGFHGNTDPIVVAALLWSIVLAEARSQPFVSGILLALACSIKIWPLILLPTFLLYLNQQRCVFQFAAGLTAGLGIFSAPYLYQQPDVIASSVLGWRSYPGLWGFTVFFPGYRAFGLPLCAAVVFGVSLAMNFARARLYSSVAAAISLFLFFTPGFGVQYLAWLMPFCFIFEGPAQIALFTASGIFLLTIYTNWSGGFPWYFADSLRTGFSYTLGILYCAFITWLLLGISMLQTGIKWHLSRGLKAKSY